MTQIIAIERVDHIGIRVRDLDRALAFYRVLGFTLVHRAVGDDVAIVRNEHGVELNLIFNANAGDPDSNILRSLVRRAARRENTRSPSRCSIAAYRRAAECGDSEAASAVSPAAELPPSPGAPTGPRSRT